MGTLSKIKAAIRGKKTYLLGAAAIIVTTVAWAAGEITSVQAATALFLEFQTIFIRAGIQKAQDYGKLGSPQD